MEANPPTEPLAYAEWSDDRLEFQLKQARFLLEELKEQNIEFEQNWRSKEI